MEHNCENAPICCEHEAHHDIIDQIILPEDEHFFDLAEFFSVMGDSTRIKILYLLFEGELCVCDISEKLGKIPTMQAVNDMTEYLREKELELRKYLDDNYPKNKSKKGENE